MLIFPAIDLFGGEAVRLFKGDYSRKTVYSSEPELVAQDFKRCGATHIHLVDLEGAKDGGTPNLATVCRIKRETGLFCEVGGGIRSMDVIEKYLSEGLDRVILGTAAVTDKPFLESAVKRFCDNIAVGVDIKDGNVAINGWMQNSGINAFEFCAYLQSIGVKTVICTDISKDGAMNGTNRELYKKLSSDYSVNIIASGGVSSIEDVKALRAMELYGAIIGKAYYTGGINIAEAVEVAK